MPKFCFSIAYCFRTIAQSIDRELHYLAYLLDLEPQS